MSQMFSKLMPPGGHIVTPCIYISVSYRTKIAYTEDQASNQSKTLASLT